VFAIGLLISLAGLDSGIDDLMRSLFGISTGLLLSGTAFAVVLAYTIRFLAASLGVVESGLSRIFRNIDAAARTLGSSVSELLVKVHLPMLRQALGAAALLIFVDSMKELPASCYSGPSISIHSPHESSLWSLSIATRKLVCPRSRSCL
jgi:iron(III) transport system permease protein